MAELDIFLTTYFFCSNMPRNPEALTLQENEQTEHLKVDHLQAHGLRDDIF